MSEEIGEGLRPGSPPPQQSSSSSSTARIVLSEAELASSSSSEWAARWRQQEACVLAQERRLVLQEGEIAELRQINDRMRVQLADSQQRERGLMRRLTAKEHEMQDYVCQLNELKTAQVPTTASLRSTLLDPAVNLLVQQLKAELQQTRSKLEDTQNELTAWKFTPDSNTGKRLMAKCRLLYQENEELGKITSSGRIAKLESDLALQKSFSEEVRQSQNELDSFLADMDEDVEGMQSTILFLQQELRKAKDATQVLQKENSNLKLMANGRSNGDSVCDVQERTDSESDSGERTRVKRVRRSSILSINYNEEDTLVLNTNGDVAMTSDAE